MIVCVITAFVTSDQFYLDIYTTWFVLFAAVMSFIIIVGTIDVIRKLNEMVRSVRRMRDSVHNSSQRKSATSSVNTRGADFIQKENETDNENDDVNQVIKKKPTDTYALSEEERVERDKKKEKQQNSNEKDKKRRSGPGMYGVLVATTKRLTYTAVATVVFFICCGMSSTVYSIYIIG